MKRNILLLSFVLFFNHLLFATGAQEPDKWLALVRYANIGFQEIKTVCPHFPFFDAKTTNEEFAPQRLNWQSKFKKEVQAFLAIGKIQKINPSLVDLEIKKLGEETPQKFENSYWNWVEASKIDRSKLLNVAPHFPIPVVTEDIANAEKIYHSAIDDWMVLFPSEVTSLFGQAELVKLNPNHNSNPNYKVSDGKLAFLSLKTPDAIPTDLSYASGNNLLDAARLEAYSKKYYWEFDRATYYNKFDPAGLADYNKQLDYLNNSEIQKEVK